MTRKRKVLAAALSLALLALLAVGAAVLVLRSSWFYGKVRAVIVSTLADATGGRVSVGALQFDWRRMRADVTSLEIAGKEPAGKPPLFRAGSVAVALKIVSLLKRDVDIQSLEIRDPRIYLIVYPDGSTNIPEPKVKRAPSQTMETILKLAVGRFQVENGLFEIESRSKVPFDLRGTDLNAALRFEPAGPRYRGEISAKELAFEGAGYHGVFSLTAAAAFEKDRIALTFARLATGNSAIQLSGVLENLAAPRALVHFDSRVTAADASRILNEKLLERGEVELAGTAQWSGGSEYSLAGRLHAYDLDYRGAYVQLRGFRADGAISAEPAGIGLRAVRLSGTADRLSVAGRVGAISIRGGDLAVDGIALAVLGGTFSGNARIRELQRFSLTGEIAGIEARRAVALYSPQALPWNSRVAGTVRAEGLLQRKYELRASADLDLEPAADSAPVRGHISAAYDTRTGTLDLGRSHVALPSSRAEFSGVLGHQMLVHLETRDFDDLLPVLGSGAAALPVKVENGSAVFDGAVTGALDDPKVTGHLTAASLVYSGEKIDSLAADVAASRQNVALRNATASRGSLRAQFEGAVELHDWKAEDSSLIAGSGSVRNASLADVLAAARQQLPLSGTLTGDAQVNGTVGNPIVKADFTAARGTFHDEPFDRIAAHLEWSGRTLTASGGQIAAGPKQI
ncbi:MAG TPA: hypothetical protein VGS58_21090, partial [Candidatus Sulfopaludibacter sp.]|nr:hypothetical protein [Candidatus Sulfopaludibacter sp.]